jgi:Skp family chaperone for outer membrane proteins
MKRIVQIACCGALLLGISPAVHAAPAANPPFLVVDINQVLAQSNDAKVLGTSLAGARDEANKTFNSMIDQAKPLVSQQQSLADQFSAASGNATSTVNKDQIKKDFDTIGQMLQSKQNEINNYKSTAEQSLADMQRTYLQAIVVKIRGVAQDIAKKRSVGAVISSETALYFDPDWDISKDVITAINAAPPVTPPPTPALPTPPASASAPAAGTTKK